MKDDWKLSTKIGFTYIGTVVGAGFASGQEILQFFTTKGLFGFIGILLSTIGFVWFGRRMMVLGARIQAKSYEALNDYLFGKRIGHVMNGFVTIVLFGVTTAMVSGTGAMAQEQVGISFHIGVLATLIIAYIVMLRGLDGILSVNTLVVPLMLVFCVLIGVNGVSQWVGGSNLVSSVSVSGVSWITSAVTYVSFNLAMAQAVLVPMGGEIRDEKIISRGAWIGGFGLGVMLLSTNFALTLEQANVLGLEIPIALIISKLGFAVKVFFLVVMWAEIFTTLIGNVYGLVANLSTVFTVKKEIITLSLFALSYVLSLVGFSNFVAFVYPFFGYCGLLLLFLLAIRKLPQT